MVTLALMILVTVIAVGLLSLSGIALRAVQCDAGLWADCAQELFAGHPIEIVDGGGIGGQSERAADESVIQHELVFRGIHLDPRFE